MNRILSSFFGFWKDADTTARQSLVAAALGWMLDAFDVMLYALVLPALMTSLRFDAQNTR